MRSDEQFITWLRGQGIETLRQAEQQMNIKTKSIILNRNERALVWFIREHNLDCQEILKAIQVDVSNSV